jgi:hypothetical protein
MGELVNGASHPTLSLLIWQRVSPDLVSMKTYPLSSGLSGIAPGVGLVGVDGGGAGAGDDGDGGAAVGLDVGKVGSVGPVLPGEAIGLPSMVLLHPVHPATSTTPVSRAERAIGNNRNVLLPEK